MPHVAPRLLDDLAAGRLAPAEAAAVRAAAASCAHCTRRLEDLVAVHAVVGRAFGAIPRSAAPADAAPTPAAASDALTARMRAIESDALTARAAASERRPAATAGAASRRPRFMGLAALAASVLLAVVFYPRPEEPRPVASGPAGRVVFTDGEALRSGEDERFHFRWTAARAGRAAIVRLDADGRARRVYPDPNPLVGAFGRATPFVAGEEIRIPPFAALDFATDAGARTARYFVVAAPAEADAATWARLDAALAGADPSAAALVARLAAIGPVEELGR